MPELLKDKGELTSHIPGHGPPARVAIGIYEIPVQLILTVWGRLASAALPWGSMTPRLILSTMCKLFSGSVLPYWFAVDQCRAAPAPQLIVVWAILWVINTLHEPHRSFTYLQCPVPYHQLSIPYSNKRVLSYQYPLCYSILREGREQ